jgi:phosphatidylserine/phosphatidylglycerophosphate/cardiolipin synthase-like enzyme
MPWLLTFNAAGGGRPWADGTDMASRAATGGNPWDNGCRVTTYIDGLTAMSAMRDALEAVILAANAPGAPAVGQRGYVYIADWRFNCLRDLSTANPWHTDWWGGGPYAAGAAALDQTAMGLVVRLLQAGVMVRIMVWLPYVAQSQVADLPAHVLDHYLAAKIVQYESNRIAPNLFPPLGVVALDARTADPWSASHHQKMMVIRSPATNVAFVGGVDLAYTRRSNLDPANPPGQFGDWQSGHTIPNPAQWWPQQAPPAVNYGFQAGPVPALTTVQASDLPETVYGDPTPAGGGAQQMWYDQHLKLEGPIVATIENQFRERWVDQASGLYELGPLGSLNFSSGQVIFSTARAYAAGQIRALPMPALPVPVAPPLPPAAPGTQVQMWRTIPLRKARTAPPPTLFKRGEFTVMAGIANAVWQAQQLIWMFDQYFWSVPLARLLNAALLRTNTLRLVLILPPYADGDKPGRSHLLRNNALQVLTAGLPRDPATGALTKVGVYNMWYEQTQGTPGALASNRGIYVHAKSHTYDNQLLVCGSANLNRRSFLCDTELACAILDPAVVTLHQQRLWAQLFPGGAPWPVPPGYPPGWGNLFFTQFQAAAAVGANSLLVRDPWEGHWTLPKNITRPLDGALPLAAVLNEVEPSSVAAKAETQPVFAQPGGQRAARLDDIVNRLENQFAIYRNPS